jgi:hypothetical protein
MCHDGTGLRGERAEARFWEVRTENGPPQTAQEPRSGSTRIKATLENRPICAVIAVRSWSPDDAQSHAPLRVEKRLRRWSHWDEIGWVHYPEIGWSHFDEIRWVHSHEILQLTIH